jgi:hypothetical protein
MQRQAIATVRLVIDEETTLDDAERLVTNALTDAELMAHVTGERIEKVGDRNGQR